MKIDAIIFDLGGVLLNIDFGVTQKAFENLGFEDVKANFGMYNQVEFFDKLDKGLIDEVEFCNEVRKNIKTEISNHQIIDAWNSMIFDIPQQRIELLKELRKNYKVFLLSNTNSIHYKYYTAEIQKLGVESYESLFDEAYFSFKHSMRKPELDFFKKVVEDHKLVYNNTLFIDDTITHTMNAASMGFTVYNLAKNEEVADLFSNGKLIL